MYQILCNHHSWATWLDEKQNGCDKKQNGYNRKQMGRKFEQKRKAIWVKKRNLVKA